LGAVEVEPSPKVQAYVKGAPCGLEDPELENTTDNGAIPEVGVVVATATGGWATAAATVIVITLEDAVFVPLVTCNCAE
jgi:hypothetical protein